MASERFENAREAIERAETARELIAVRDAWMDGRAWLRMLPREQDLLSALWSDKLSAIDRGMVR